MASSTPWKKWDDFERENWHRDLRDIDCWLNGHNKAVEYRDFLSTQPISRVFWIFWAGSMASFTPAISSIHLERIIKINGPYEHVIKVDLKYTPTAEEDQDKGIASIKYQLTLTAAKELGLINQGYNRQKEYFDKEQYYTYGCDDEDPILQRYVQKVIASLVGKHLSAKKYLLVINNLMWPIELGSLTRDCGFPPPMWADSAWLISPTSKDIYNKSKSRGDGIICYKKDGEVLLSILFALRQSAEYIRLNTIHQESIEYWHDLAINCFHYAMAIFAKHSQAAAVTSDELVHQLATLLPLPVPCMTMKDDEANTVSNSKCYYMHRVGRVILEAFQKYSLLQLPFSPAHEPHEATNTGIQFLEYHGLITQDITVEELYDNKKKWISFVGDHGRHVSREWLFSQGGENCGTAALILRGCSQQSIILSKLDHFLPKLCFLRVLDLSYTPLKSLPSSIGRLHNLRLLSLRGCYDLKILSSSSTTSATDSTTENTSSPLSTLYQLQILDLNGVPLSHLTQDVANQKSNLIHLDMSHSETTTFPPNFFRDMLNLEELILVNCSNLVELPPSMVALSSLTTLEITWTQIKFFPQKIFEEMKKLQSLKLIDNKKLVSLPESISSAYGLINLHIEGYESEHTEEFKFKGHPTLVSFILIRAPRIRLLSLRGCRKLESVEFKSLDALEELDLSATAIKELSADIPNGTQLRILLLLGVPSLLRFPWHMLQRLPEVFCLDQCTEGNGSHSDQLPQLCVSDPWFFHSFRESCVRLVRDGRFFQSFYVRVTPCSTNNMQLQREEGMVRNKLPELVQKQSTYMDVHISCYADEIAIVSPITVPLGRTERHVEITGIEKEPYGLSGLLNVTKSLSVTNDTSILDFSACSGFQDLEECELGWCHKMESVFYHYVDIKNLRNLHVCHLKRLVMFCAQYALMAFSSLVHLHLEDCPRLEHVLSDAVRLPCLKTLDILLCYNLKGIFVDGDMQYNSYQLPRLERVRLHELPLLDCFQEKDATITAQMWKELYIRGCWSLRRLPRLHDQREIVKVNGEKRWWNKLKWGSPLHRNNYEPKLPPKFSSFIEHAEVTSYLR